MKNKLLSIKHYFLFLLIFALIIHLFFSFQGIEHTITDRHDFRQTQTAITAYYILKEGIRLDYSTPILGKPWSIPMEFPIYQWIVALLKNFSGMKLDASGRIVSLFFFYGTLCYLYKVFDFLAFEKRVTLLLFVLVSPIYIFWSRTFMIESLAIFCSVAFIYYIRNGFVKNSYLYFVLAGIFGVLSGLTKVTTFSIYLIIAVFIFSYYYSLEKSKLSLITIKKYLVVGVVCYLFPFLVAFAWVKYADMLKEQNPLSKEFLTSGFLQNWNFGTREQKLSFLTYQTIIDYYLPIVVGEKVIRYFYIFFVIWAVLLGKRKNIAILSLLFFIFFWIAPIIYTNLYLVHDYYYYANSLFLLLSMALIITILYDIEKIKIHRITQFILLPLLLVSIFNSYKKYYLPLQKKNHTEFIEITKAIQDNSNENDVIFIIGYDWNSKIPYYSERKAIMDRLGSSVDNAPLQKSISITGKENIKLLLIGKEFLEKGNFPEQWIQFFGLKNKEIYSGNYGNLYKN